jgi:methylated-DNA-protein-cysteine methyltransferase-like protein
VAAYAGVPRAAREVGWIMNELGGEVPWWRVLNNKGYISIRGNATADKELQKKLLEAEGIEVSENFELDMRKYRYSPDKETLKTFGNADDYTITLIAKYSL